MVPVLVVDGDVEDGVDVGDGEREAPVPHRRHGLVLGVRLQPLVVQLQHDEGVAANHSTRSECDLSRVPLGG